MRTNGGDVVIVGAGLIGLSVAWELARLGARVRVFDRGEAARAASWAGAGMLAPHTEGLDDAAMLRLCAESLSMYADFVERLRDEGGADARLHVDGILNVAYDPERAAELQARAVRLRESGEDCEWLDAPALRIAEPALDPGARGALLVRGEGHVDNRVLGRALTAACRARGVTIVRDAGEVAVDCDARRARGVRSAIGFTAADCVVNAAGAWAARLAGVPPAYAPPVEPVKGQMLALAVPRGFVRRATWVPGAYLVPRDDGRLMVGATVERCGFDQRVTARGQRDLLAAVLRAAPSLGGFTVAETWAGLRPGTPDGRPFLGPSGLEGLWLATGHARNGILLAPVTGRLLASAIAGGSGEGLRPFSLSRLQTEPRGPARTTHV
ncbi:MAG: glycine oxidase ThiO [Vulcanimicrobiaceae bacterium]